MRKITTKPAPISAKPATAKPRALKIGDKLAGSTAPAPVNPAAVATAKAGTNSNLAPVTTGKRKPAPVTATTEPVAAQPASPSRNVTRTAATIAKQLCNFGGLTDRDTAYLSFYASLGKLTGGTVTVRAIAESGRRPDYSGSSKPHDAGVIQRLAKAGLLTVTPDGGSFTFSPAARTHAAYIAGNR